MPLRSLALQLPATRRREDIGLYAAAGVGYAPFTPDEPALFEPVERREERAGTDGKRAACDLLDAVGDVDAMPRLGLERAEDEHGQCSLEEFDASSHAGD